MFTACQLDKSNTRSLPDKSEETSDTTESDPIETELLSDIETELLAAGYSQSQVDNIIFRARSRVVAAGLESSTDIAEVGPELLRGALDGVTDMDDTDAKVQAIEILTNCMILSSQSVVSASRAAPRLNVAAGPQFSVADYSDLIKTITAISFEYLDDIGLDETEINEVATAVIKGIAENLKNSGVADEDLPAVVRAITQGAVSSLDEMGKTDSEKAATIEAITSGTFQGLAEMGLSTSTIATMADEVTAGAVAGLTEAGVDDSNIDSLITDIKSGINDGLEDAGLTTAEIAAVQDAINDAADEGKTSLPLKTITDFSFTAALNSALSADVTATISGTDITATVPYGTDVTALIATFTIIGESITIGSTSQTSETTANDFSSAVTYTVTGSDALTQDFTVTIAFDPRPAGDTDTYQVRNYDDTAWITFIMVNVPGGLSFPTGTADNGIETVAGAYLIAQTEVTYGLWYAVRDWALSNSYSFSNAGREGNTGTDGALPSATPEEPVSNINWRDAMVWMNAFTEYYNAQNGTSLTPVYSYNGSTIKDSQDSNATACDNLVTDSTATGFRLLTSNEWELAARYIDDANSDGDILDAGEYYPGDYASGATADYTDAGASGLVAVYGAGASVDVKSKSANALGLNDISGSMWEYVFDLAAGERIVRSGSWNLAASYLQVGSSSSQLPQAENASLGLRFARSQ